MPDRIPVLLDTDIGSDIDDALCLAYLLRQPQCELVGITTVSGEPEQRARLASAICRAAGRDDVSIHSGSPEPLFTEQKQKGAAQAEILSRFPHQDEIEPCTAIEFMRRTIRSRPEEIVLLSVGPLTNVGLLFALDPEMPHLLRGMVSMMGAFFPHATGEKPLEWNASGDPHATAIVLRTRTSGGHRLVGLDVTTLCRMPADECRSRFLSIGGPFLVVAEMAEVWFRRTDRITFHDPLAAAVIFQPELCKFREGEVEVRLFPPEKQGETSWTPRLGGRHQVAVHVDPERFFQHYFEVVERKP